MTELIYYAGVFFCWWNLTINHFLVFFSPLERCRAVLDCLCGKDVNHSPNSFSAIGVLAGLIEGLVVVGHSVAAKWVTPFVAIFMTWWHLPSKTHRKIDEKHGFLHFSKEVLQFFLPSKGKRLRPALFFLVCKVFFLLYKTNLFLVQEENVLLVQQEHPLVKGEESLLLVQEEDLLLVQFCFSRNN